MHLWPGMLYGALKKMTGAGLVDEAPAPSDFAAAGGRPRFYRITLTAAGPARPKPRGWPASWTPPARSASSSVHGRPSAIGHAADHLPDPAVRVPARRQARLRRRDGGRRSSTVSRSSERDGRASARIVAAMRGLARRPDLRVLARDGTDGERPREPDHHIRSRRPLVILRDVRGTMRLMRSQPALTAGIVLMLALGIGATTAIFSVVYGVLLKPLPFPGAGPARPGLGIAAVARAEQHVADRSELLGHARHEPVALGARRAARRELHAHRLRDSRSG